jgi:hypothetical protein
MELLERKGQPACITNVALKVSHNQMYLDLTMSGGTTSKRHLIAATILGVLRGSCENIINLLTLFIPSAFNFSSMFSLTSSTSPP